jgi:hypothetical protein
VAPVLLKHQRECLDWIFFWTTADLEAKLLGEGNCCQFLAENDDYGRGP